VVSKYGMGNVYTIEQDEREMVMVMGMGMVIEDGRQENGDRGWVDSHLRIPSFPVRYLFSSTTCLEAAEAGTVVERSD
jgi:hypothetical protein